MKKIDYVIAPNFDEAVERMIEVCKKEKGIDFSVKADIVSKMTDGKLCHIWVHTNVRNESLRLALDSKGNLSIFKWCRMWVAVDSNFINLANKG